MDSILEFIISPLDCATFVGGYDSDDIETYSQEEYEMEETVKPMLLDNKRIKGKGEDDEYKPLGIYTWGEAKTLTADEIVREVNERNRRLLRTILKPYETQNKGD
jgi:hypothetical protein